MGIEKQLVAEKVKELQVKEFLNDSLTRVGYSGAEIKRTPLGTRIILNVLRPGRIIGRGGHKIKELTRTLQRKFNLENPHIEVREVEVPELDPVIQAKRIASSLERGFHFKRVGHRALSKIIEAGALGAEVTISGKIPGKRGRVWKFTGGYIKHCGEASDVSMERGLAVAYMKPGVIGIQVKIMAPGVQLPDAILRTGKKPTPIKEEPGADKTEAKSEKEETSNGDSQN
ncbi:MAG: 30S ribosomal protein S3 [Candidatus Undinarchaeales archaeon]|jgi:small subunit ribosomal protein S3|nr:30S ribosomal protein S3 [Candidatus Undinarchaeales archaeon]MDP7494695.1 30S ribosomal protein S3 [Candidatus Undinarchaeales archaeon]